MTKEHVCMQQGDYFSLVFPGSVNVLSWDIQIELKGPSGFEYRHIYSVTTDLLDHRSKVERNVNSVPILHPDHTKNLPSGRYEYSFSKHHDGVWVPLYTGTIDFHQRLIEPEVDAPHIVTSSTPNIR